MKSLRISVGSLLLRVFVLTLCGPLGNHGRKHACLVINKADVHKTGTLQLFSCLFICAKRLPLCFDDPNKQQCL